MAYSKHGMWRKTLLGAALGTLCFIMIFGLYNILRTNKIFPSVSTDMLVLAYISLGILSGYFIIDAIKRPQGFSVPLAFLAGLSFLYFTLYRGFISCPTYLLVGIISVISSLVLYLYLEETNARKFVDFICFWVPLIFLGIYVVICYELPLLSASIPAFLFFNIFWFSLLLVILVSILRPMEKSHSRKQGKDVE